MVFLWVKNRLMILIPMLWQQYQQQLESISSIEGSAILMNDSHLNLTLFAVKQLFFLGLELSLAYLSGILLGTLILYIRHYIGLKNELKKQKSLIKSNEEERERRLKKYLSLDLVHLIRLGCEANISQKSTYFLLILNTYILLPYLMTSSIISSIFLERDLLLVLEKGIQRYFVFSFIFMLLEVLLSKKKLAWENDI
jgi:hypothetical protein